MKNKYKYTTLERTIEASLTSLTLVSIVSTKGLQSYGHIEVKTGT